MAIPTGNRPCKNPQLCKVQTHRPGTAALCYGAKFEKGVGVPGATWSITPAQPTAGSPEANEDALKAYAFELASDDKIASLSRELDLGPYSDQPTEKLYAQYHERLRELGVDPEDVADPQLEYAIRSQNRGLRPGGGMDDGLRFNRKLMDEADLNFVSQDDRAGFYDHLLSGDREKYDALRIGAKQKLGLNLVVDTHSESYRMGGDTYLVHEDGRFIKGYVSMNHINLSYADDFGDFQVIENVDEVDDYLPKVGKRFDELWKRQLEG